MKTPQRITIPRGATLSGLARQYRTTVSALMAANPQIRDPNVIRAGAGLNIPTPTPTITAPTARQPSPAPARTYPHDFIGPLRPQDIRLPDPAVRVTPVASQAVVPQAVVPQTETARIRQRIEDATRQIEEKRDLIEKAKVAGLEPHEKIPDWVVAAESPEEVARELKPQRIRELERTAFAPAPQTWEQIFTDTYSKAGLADVSKRVRDLDAKILKAREDLNTAETEIQENPWLSEAGRVGRIRRLYEIAQKDIDLLIRQREPLMDQYRQGVELAERTAERALRGWAEQQELHRRELDYLIRTGEAEERLSLAELERMNRHLPAGQRLPFGTTKREAMERGIVPVEVERVEREREAEAPTVRNFGTDRNPNWRQWDPRTQTWIPYVVPPARVEDDQQDDLQVDARVLTDDQIREEIIRSYDEGRSYGEILNEINSQIGVGDTRNRWIDTLKRVENERRGRGQGTIPWWQRWITPGI